jgi:LmbE family N-acetylglucosaminyl deacetylase
MMNVITIGLILVTSLSLHLDAKFNPLEAKRVIVFAPHPDDDILGCGGVAALHRQQGAEVAFVYMTSGDAERLSGFTGPELARVREEEAKKGAEKVGVTNLTFLRQPDGKLARTQTNVDEVHMVIDQYQPDLIYIPHKDDGHKDHQATFWIVEKAVKETIRNPLLGKRPVVLCYEVWTPLQKLTHKINISSVIDTKLDALSEHKSQLAGSSNTNYVEAIKALNRYRGIMTWVGDYAECFQELVLKS